MDCRSSVRVVFQLDVSTRKEAWFGRGSGEGVEEVGCSLDRPRVAEALRSPLAVLAAIALLARSTLCNCIRGGGGGGGSNCIGGTRIEVLVLGPLLHPDISYPSWRVCSLTLA